MYTISLEPSFGEMTLSFDEMTLSFVYSCEYFLVFPIYLLIHKTVIICIYNVEAVVSLERTRSTEIRSLIVSYVKLVI